MDVPLLYIIQNTCLVHHLFWVAVGVMQVRLYLVLSFTLFSVAFLYLPFCSPSLCSLESPHCLLLLWAYWRLV